MEILMAGRNEETRIEILKDRMKRCVGIDQEEGEKYLINLNSKNDQWSRRHSSKGMDSEDSDESGSRRRVKRKFEDITDEDGEAEMGMEVEEDIINSETCDIKSLREALRRQHQLNEKLQYELDKERDASADSTQEALAMIYRLQKEKHDTEREASLFKKIQACAEQEKLSLENLLDEKDYVIETLRSEIQSLKQSVRVQYHNNSNVNHEIRSSNPADDFSEVKEVVNDHALLISLAESSSQKRGAEQLEIFTGNNISTADKQSTNSENANENSSMNVNMNKKRCILITEKESNTSKVSDQAADALAQPQFMEEDDENNDTCIVGSGFDFSVSDRLAHDKDVQQIFGRMQTLVAERKSMAQTIEHLKMQNGVLMELITKFAHQQPINEEETQKPGHKLSKKTTKGKTRSTVNTIAPLPQPGWIYFFLMGWTILIVALLKPGYL